MAHAIGILGPGRLGRSLAISLRGSGARVHLRGREAGGPVADWLAEVEVVILTVRDDQLEAVVASLTGLDWTAKTAMMCAGAVPLEVLRPLSERGAVIGKFHPLQAFSEPRGQPVPSGTPWAIEGPIEALVAPWVHAWSGSLHILGPTDWARYHLAAVFSANFLPLFIRAGARILEPLARDPADAIAWLAPLVRHSVRGALDPAKALPFSGPAVRGDTRVLEKQIGMLEEMDAAWADLYRRASEAIARERDRQ